MGETPVGFAFYGYWQERDRYLLCRYMIDVRYQGRGYGTRALPLVVEQIRRQYGCRDVYTTVDDENTRAVKLYRSFGFQPTEEMDEAERVYVLRGGGRLNGRIGNSAPMGAGESPHRVLWRGWRQHGVGIPDFRSVDGLYHQKI